MPGHKRNTELAPYLKKLSADIDITEIHGFDNLHSPNDFILDYMKKAENLWNSNNSYFLVNGSTCGILAAIRSCVNFGDEILLTRSCHKSVYHAIEICGLKASYIVEDTLEDTGIKLPLDKKKLEKALTQNPNIKLFVITTPTYEGVISNIDEITDICHKKNIPVVLDAAHGAHLNFSKYFSQNVNLLCADVVIQSLHKTLPSLTQTAIVHFNSTLVNKSNFKRQLTIFQSSSPSYLLMTSICECIDLLTEKSKELFDFWEENLNQFYKNTNSLQHIKILDFDMLNIPQDKSKIIINCSSANISGFKLLEILRENYNIDLEMALETYAVAMSSIADSKESLIRFSKALTEIDKSLKTIVPYKMEIDFSIKIKDSIYASLSKEQKLIPLDKAIGKTSADYVWIYPPGIPYIVPGEEITEKLIHDLKDLQTKGANVEMSKGNFPLNININLT